MTMTPATPPASDSEQTEVILDLRGLSCPLPVLQTNRMLKTMTAGQYLRVWTSDPKTLDEIPALCQKTGHQYLDSQTTQDGYWFLIRREA